MSLIIFDLDGTLVDSIDGIGYSMNIVLKEMGYRTHDKETYKSFVGNGIQRLVELAVPPDTGADSIEKSYIRMLEVYQDNYDYKLKVYNDIKSLLVTLEESSHRLAVLTNKHQSMAKPIVKKYFHDINFESIIGRQEGRPKKPDPTSTLGVVEGLGCSIEDTYFVGDSEVDLMTARNSGVKDVIVTWGFRQRKDLEALKPTYMIDEPKALLDIIK